jgi:hypothetical protein
MKKMAVAVQLKHAFPDHELVGSVFSLPILSTSPVSQPGIGSIVADAI